MGTSVWGEGENRFRGGWGVGEIIRVVTTNDPAEDHLLDNAVWHALSTEHASWAEARGTARRYPTDVCVFTGVEVLDRAGWADLAALVGPSTRLALFRAAVPEPPVGWTVHHRGRGNQLTITAAALEPSVATIAEPLLRRLTVDDAGEALALVELTRPGPFEERTLEMGRYWGHFDTDDRLLAMAGERLHLTGHTEISAVCTHPDGRGRGLAATLTRQVALGILERGETPFLHVAESNDAALRVYERLGFHRRRTVEFAFVESPPAP
jgi:predicted GNAT family acetyltransferase